VIKLRLNELLAERGLTPYRLWKQTGIRWASIWQMSKGDTSRLHIGTLDRICEALECQPGDLLVRVESKARGKVSRKKGKKR
jgi:putative transcriptional regulator